MVFHAKGEVRRGFMIEVVEVKNRQDRTAFIKLPGMLAKDDPAWIEPLWFERSKFLSPKHNPFFKRAEISLWIARRNGKPVGRISAQIDPAACKDNKKIGHFGLLDAREDDVLTALMETAETWLKSKSVSLIQGPFSFSINQTSGLLVHGFETPPYILMDHHDPWLGTAVERQGYVKAKDLMTYELNSSKDLPDRMRRTAHKSSQKIKIRSLDMRRYKQDIQAMTTIYNKAWSNNWGFIPLTQEDSAEMAQDLKPILDPELIK